MKSVTFMISGLITALFTLTGCGGKQASEEESGLFKVVLQTDWYAQPEHGGFYQAMVMGYYAEEGLEVEILQGGPNSLTSQKLAQGTAQFGIGRSDDVIIGAARGIPLMIVGALMQKDPQALMFHRESGITRVEDLDGRSIMAGPGSAFLELLKIQYGIDFSVIPVDYGMNRFLADKEFIQQCFITNEPYYVARAGANVETILLSDTGFQPYRVWFTSRSFLRRHPDKVAAFHRASIRGWQEYLFGDRSKANAEIASRNPKMDEDFMAFGHGTMIETNLVTGDSADPAFIGTVTTERIAEQIEQLHRIKMIPELLSVDDVLHRVNDRGADTDGSTPSQASMPGAPGNSLPVKDLSGRLLHNLGEQDFLSHPLQSREVEIETAGKLTSVRGLNLLDVLADLKLPPNWDLVLANCSDGYQSNFTREVLRRNFPFLILEIEGQTTADWAAAQGNPGWGPFMIQTLNPDGLIDPVNKNPWGVNALIVGRTETWLQHVAAGFSNAADAHAGFQIFKANCASCHQFADTKFGGVVSGRTVGMLGQIAKFSEPYFRSMLKDPVGTNVLAAKMPPATHYDEDQVSALIGFLSAMAAN